MTGLLRDVRGAATALWRSKGFALIAVLTLGLGIGANTAMFSILDGYLLRKSPYPRSDALERIYRSTLETPRGGVSPADYLDLKREMAPYGEIAAYGPGWVSLKTPSRPAESAMGLRSSSNLFRVLLAKAELGRTFRDEEEAFGNHHLLVLSHRYWQNHFGGDGHVIGSTVKVDGEPCEIIGVLPETFSDFRHLSWVDVYRPLGLDEKEVKDRNSTWLELVGRRGPSVGQGQAAAFLDGFSRRLARDFPAADGASTWTTVPISGSFLPKSAVGIMVLLIGLSGFVLLIACSNLANLLLARTMGRSREIALRGALGATKAQVMRPLLLESLLLALSGGLLSVLVALWVFRWTAVASAGDNGVGVDLSLNWRILGWAFLACLTTAVAFSLAPALFADRLDLQSALKTGGRGSFGSRGQHSFRHFLIVFQFALAMVLLAGAALFARGLSELNNRRHGWESDSLVTGTVVLPTTTYKDDRALQAFERASIERLEALPGVASASLSYAMPFFGLAEARKLVVLGREEPQPGHEPAAAVNGVSPHYFETVGTRLLSGRTFKESDTSGSPKVYVINETMARDLFPSGSPLGRRLAEAGSRGESGEIVGVASDVQSVFDDPGQNTYQLYIPLQQEPRRTSEIALKTTKDAPEDLIDSVRLAMEGLDPDLPVRKLQTAGKRIARANYQDGVLGSMLKALATLGLALASLGVYGVVSRAVAQRTGEFGVRLALGARPGDVKRLVLTQGAKLALLGSLLGLMGALGLSRLFSVAFPNMRMSNGPVLLGATVFLVLIAQVASYLPARHASRISPTEALRAE